MNEEAILAGAFLAVLVFAIVGMAIEKHYHDRKGDNGMRRRMTDRRVKRQMGWRSSWDRVRK